MSARVLTIAMFALAPPTEVTADEKTGASLFWTIAPGESAKLPRGERTMRAVLECKESAHGAWIGVATSREIRVQVVAEPKRLRPEWAERKAEVQIDFAYCREGAARARAAS